MTYRTAIVPLSAVNPLHGMPYPAQAQQKIQDTPASLTSEHPVLWKGSPSPSPDPPITVHKSFLNVTQNKYFRFSHYYWSIPPQNPKFSDNSHGKGVKELARNKKCFFILTGKKETPGSKNAVSPHVLHINTNPHILLIVLTEIARGNFWGKKPVDHHPRWTGHRQKESERGPPPGTVLLQAGSAGCPAQAPRGRKSQRIRRARDHFPRPQHTELLRTAACSTILVPSQRSSYR